MTFNITNITRPYEMFQVANSMTDHLMGTIFALLIFIIALSSLSVTGNRPFGYAYAVASYITVILVVILRVLTLVPDWVVYISVIMAVGGIAYTSYSRGE